MAIHSARAQPLRRADVAVSVLHLSRADPGDSSQPASEQGKVDVATPCHGPVVSGNVPCEAELWLYGRSAHSTAPALRPRGRGVCKPGPQPAWMDGAWPGTSEASWDGTAALAMLLCHPPKFLSCTCTGVFSDSAVTVRVGC